MDQRCRYNEKTYCIHEDLGYCSRFGCLYKPEPRPPNFGKDVISEQFNRETGTYEKTVSKVFTRKLTPGQKWILEGGRDRLRRKIRTRELGGLEENL